MPGEAFNPAVGDATSFSGASTRLAGNCAQGQHGDGWERWHHAGTGRHPAWPNTTQGKGGRCLSGTPPMSQHHPMDHSALGIRDVGRAVPALACCTLVPLWSVLMLPSPSPTSGPSQPAKRVISTGVWWGMTASSPFLLAIALEKQAGRLAPAGQEEESQVRDHARSSNPNFGPKPPYCVAKTQGCCWEGSRGLIAWAVLQRAAPIGEMPWANSKPLLSPGGSLAAFPCPPPRFLQGPVTCLKDAGTDWEEQPQAVSAQGRGRCWALAPGDQPRAPPRPN